MYPDDQATPPPQPNYDFIMAPKNSKKPQGPLKNVSSNAFIMKLVFIVGSVVLLMITTAIFINIFFGNKTNLDDIVAITQTENELVRVASQGVRANSDDVRNASTNTRLSITTQQAQWLDFLNTRGTKLDNKALALKKDLTTDQKLQAATASTTFDSTFTVIMRTQLTAYAAQLKEAYTNASASNKTERALLNNDYKQIVLLMQQWPKE